MSMTNRRSFAAGVSRALRRHDIRPLPSGTARSREGIRVTTSYTDARAGISVDLDNTARAERIALLVTAALKAEGYTVEVNPHDPCLLTAVREEVQESTLAEQIEETGRTHIARAAELAVGPRD